MSEKTELAPLSPAVAEEVNDGAPRTGAPLDRLTARDYAQILVGFHFLFWGLLVLLAALTESLVVSTLRPFSTLLIGAGSLALVIGAWRLRRVSGLGSGWQNRTRDLFIGALLAAYLSLFYLMWRQQPRTMYLLAHALMFGAVIIALLCLLSLTVAALASAADRRNLAVQCIAFGTIAVVLLFPAFALVAQMLVTTTWEGRDPFVLLRFWIENTPIPLTLLALLPFSLTLSLLWSAKDLVWDRLNVKEPPTV